MIWQLIRRDQAWRCLPWLAAASAVACLLWHFVPELRDALLLLVAYPVFSLTPAYASNFQHRDVYFQASLPITPRQIYLSRVFSMIVLLWLPVAMGVAFGRATSHPRFAVTLLDFGSLFLVGIIAIQSVFIQCKLRKPGVYAFNLFWLCGWGACTISGLPGWLLRQGILTTVVFPAVCWLVIAAILRGTWRTLPQSFDFAPGALFPADVGRDAWRKGWVPFARWRLVFVDILSTHPFLIVCCAIVGMLPASKWAYQTGSMLWLFLGFAWASTRSKTRWLVALPVPRRTLLASILLPTLLAVSSGYELGLRIPRIADTMERGVVVTASGEAEIANISKDCKMFNVIPPLEFRVRAPADHAPVIRAPWGETFQPATNSFIGFDVYNPYASDCGNSEPFLDWEFARATAAVYGRPIPRDRTAGSYVVVSQLAIPRIRKQLVTIALMAFCLMLMLLIAILEDWYRLRLLRRVYPRVICLVPALFFITLFVLCNDMSQWLSWALPSNPFGAIALAIVPLALIYWALETMFRHLEFDHKPVRGGA
jgi:hypothetical protein